MHTRHDSKIYLYSHIKLLQRRDQRWSAKDYNRSDTTITKLQPSKPHETQHQKQCWWSQKRALTNICNMSWRNHFVVRNGGIERIVPYMTWWELHTQADWCSGTRCNHCRTMRKKCSDRTVSTIGFVCTRWSILLTVWAIWYVHTWRNWCTTITTWNFEMCVGSRERCTRCRMEGMHLW